jgi:hypothetical protein
MTVIPINRGPKSTSPAAKPIVSAKSDIELEIARDQWDRPLILPPDGVGKPVAYRRASSVAEVLEDHYGLHQWQLRLVVEGLAQRPDLVQSTHTATKREIGLIAETAMEQAGAGVASRNGTTMHALTDLHDRGLPLPKGLPANIEAMLEVYIKTTSRLEMLDSERFVVCDAIKVAGTYDRRVRDKKTGLEVIGDLKTGQNLKYLAVKAPAQVAVYAAGDHYDLDGEREAHGADRDRGMLIWLPWTDDPSEAICELRWLDLKIGRAAIKEAMRIDTLRKLTEAQTMPRVK